MNQFISGILISLGILALTFVAPYFSIPIWFIVLILVTFMGKYSLAKGMALGVAIAIFIFLIICGGYILSW